jgi:hypothetical protein
LGTARWRVNTFKREIFSRTEKETEWRVCRAQIVSTAKPMIVDLAK